MKIPTRRIYLMDDPDTIIRKCKRAVTDSEGTDSLSRRTAWNQKPD